jgi:predicted RNA-binding Zn ribbon-like protein
MNTLWLDLLNTDYHDYKGGGRDEDRLENPQWLGKFLNYWKNIQIQSNSRLLINQLKDLRSLIGKIVEKFRLGEEIQKTDLNSLNKILAKSPIVYRLESSDREYSFTQYSVNSGIESILSDIASSFAEILVQGEAERIKTCENKDCRWIFYDISKNRSRKWCEGGTGCGNLMKVRRFRERNKNKNSE